MQLREGVKKKRERSGQARGVDPSGQPDRFFPVFFDAFPYTNIKIHKRIPLTIKEQHFVKMLAHILSNTEKYCLPTLRKN